MAPRKAATATRRKSSAPRKRPSLPRKAGTTKPTVVNAPQTVSTTPHSTSTFPKPTTKAVLLPCNVCKHFDRARVERELTSSEFPLAVVAKRWGLGVTSCRTHLLRCMPTYLERARGSLRAEVLKPLPIEEVAASPLLARLLFIENMGIEVLEKAVKNEDLRNVSAIMGQLLRAAELRAKQGGEIGDKRTDPNRPGSLGGIHVLVLPQLPERANRGVLAAPLDGSRVSPAVAAQAIDLEVIEAEQSGADPNAIPKALQDLLDSVQGVEEPAMEAAEASSEESTEQVEDPQEESNGPEIGTFTWKSSL